MEKQSQVLQAVHELRDLLPQNKNAAILDIGFGQGWFLAACLKLGYRELSGADFGIAHKDYIRTWSERPIQLYEIEDNIGNFLSDRAGQYDFIHLSHVIEHIPKYSLLWVVDALYPRAEAGWRVDAAHPQHGRPVRELQPLRHAGPRVRILRLKPGVAARYLRLR